LEIRPPMAERQRRLAEPPPAPSCHVAAHPAGLPEGSFTRTLRVPSSAISPATTASPTSRASVAAGRSKRLRTRSAIGEGAGAIVSATMIGSTITRSYGSSAYGDHVAAQTSTRHDQLAVRPD